MALRRHRIAALVLCAGITACAAEVPNGVPSDGTAVRDRPSIGFGDGPRRDAGQDDHNTLPDAVALRDARPPAPDLAPPPCTLTEGSAAEWTTACMPGTLPCSPSLTDDALLHVDGQDALRWRCVGCGFDSWIAYAAPASGWDLTPYDHLRFSVRTTLDESPFGWQGGIYGYPPWIILRDRAGRTKRVEPAADADLLNSSVDVWLLVSVPLGAAAGWQSAVEPGFSSADVTALEIHVDPWGGGFTLWLDGAAFGPAAFSGCR